MSPCPLTVELVTFSSAWSARGYPLLVPHYKTQQEIIETAVTISTTRLDTSTAYPRSTARQLSGLFSLLEVTNVLRVVRLPDILPCIRNGRQLKRTLHFGCNMRKHIAILMVPSIGACPQTKYFIPSCFTSITQKTLRKSIRTTFGDGDNRVHVISPVGPEVTQQCCYHRIGRGSLFITRFRISACFKRSYMWWQAGVDQSFAV